MNQTFRRACLALAVGASVSGCTSLTPRANDQQVNALLAARQGPVVVWSAVNQDAEERQAIDQWLAAPMTVESAVRVAMLRSPRLQQEYARLGLAHAEVLEAVQIGNPRLALSRQTLGLGTGTNRIVGLSLPLADLLVLPIRARLARTEYGRAQLEIAGAVLSVTADVEAAWYRYVGAQQVADMRTAVAVGTVASSELAQRFFDAGNISELQLKQEQAAASEARIEAAQARAEAGRARLALNTLIGLSGKATGWATSDRLPVPVESEDDPDQLADLARSSNLELLAARQQADILADALGITRRLGWLGSSEIGYEREKDASGERLRGPTLDLELPIFNQGQAKVARAEALLAEARARVALAELGVDNAIRLGAQQVRELSEVVAIHRDALIPQSEKVVERSQQEQNYMLIGVFELIQAKVKEYDAYEGYLVAVRDYWLARVELTRVVGQRLPSAVAIGERTPSVQDILTPKAEAVMPGMDHSGHDMSSMPGMDHSGMKMPAKPPAATPAPHDHSQHGAPATEAPPAPSPEVEDETDDEPMPENDHDHGGTP